MVQKVYLSHDSMTGSNNLLISDFITIHKHDGVSAKMYIWDMELSFTLDHVDMVSDSLFMQGIRENYVWQFITNGGSV